MPGFPHTCHPSYGGLAPTPAGFTFLLNTLAFIGHTEYLDTTRPTFPVRDFHHQNSLKPWRCQRITVSGCTISRADLQFDQIRDMTTRKFRSRLRTRGRFILRALRKLDDEKK